MVDGKLHRHLDHIVARAHIGEGPTLFLELLDEMTQRLTRPLAGSILHAIGDDGDNGSGVLVVLDVIVQTRQ